MCTLPDHERVIAMDRPNDGGIPALEATHCQAPQGPKVDHFMTSGIRIGKYARETLIAGSEFVELVARDGAEAPWPGDSLARSRTWEHENMKRALAREGRHPVRH